MKLEKLIQGLYLKKLRLHEFTFEVKIYGEDLKDIRLNMIIQKKTGISRINKPFSSI